MSSSPKYQVSVTRPNQKTLEDISLEMGDIFDEGEEGYIRRAKLDDEIVVLKGFHERRDNNRRVQHSYNALNELSEIGCEVIEDYGYITLEDSTQYLLLKDLGQVCAEQFFVRNGSIDELPFHNAQKIRKNKTLCSIHNISFGVCDEHMIYRNDEGELDACIVDVGPYTKSPFGGKLAQKISRDSYKHQNFIEIFTQMVGGDKELAKQILTEYEKSHPKRLEDLELEYQSFISSVFTRTRGIPFTNLEYKNYMKRRGYNLPEKEDVLEGILFFIDHNYYFENQFNKRIFSWSSQSKNKFRQFDQNSDLNETNLSCAFAGVDIAYQAAMDLDITFIRQILNGDNIVYPQLKLEDKLPKLQTILDKFDENEMIQGEIYLDSENLEEIGTLDSLIARGSFSLRDYIFGTENNYVFDPKDIQEIFIRSFTEDLQGFETRESPIKPQDIEMGYITKEILCYYVHDCGIKTTSGVDYATLRTVSVARSSVFETQRIYDNLSNETKNLLEANRLSHYT